MLLCILLYIVVTFLEEENRFPSFPLRCLDCNSSVLDNAFRKFPTSTRNSFYNAKKRRKTREILENTNEMKFLTSTCGINTINRKEKSL
mmetsp:Transcript_3214/g.4787  ORF Transcript_3214/g.4787 Transcript_3214/m.4787 type:complete len:89 (+) Transcript_3214:1237-1503(+)